MPFKTKILSIFKILKLYIINKQEYTPPLNYFHFFRLTIPAKLFGHELQLHKLYNGGFTVYYPAFFLGNFKISYNYVHCCTTKFIFALGKNEFDKLWPQHIIS